MNATEQQQIAALLQRVERLIRTWPHLRPFVEKIVNDAERQSQQWKSV
jgi:hypothetical protein